jgi:hypothetical protein
MSTSPFSPSATAFGCVRSENTDGSNFQAALGNLTACSKSCPQDGNLVVETATLEDIYALYDARSAQNVTVVTPVNSTAISISS